MPFWVEKRQPECQKREITINSRQRTITLCKKLPWYWKYDNMLWSYCQCVRFNFRGAAFHWAPLELPNGTGIENQQTVNGKYSVFIISLSFISSEKANYHLFLNIVKMFILYWFLFFMNFTRLNFLSSLCSFPLQRTLSWLLMRTANSGLDACCALIRADISFSSTIHQIYGCEVHSCYRLDTLFFSMMSQKHTVILGRHVHYQLHVIKLETLILQWKSEKFNMLFKDT